MKNLPNESVEPPLCEEPPVAREHANVESEVESIRSSAKERQCEKAEVSSHLKNAIFYKYFLHFLRDRSEGRVKAPESRLRGIQRFRGRRYFTLKPV